jgi:hypothetical protein
VGGKQPSVPRTANGKDAPIMVIGRPAVASQKADIPSLDHSAVEGATQILGHSPI